MNVIAQLITVFQNGTLSVAGNRDLFELENVEDETGIKQKINERLAKLGKRGGHVLLKYEKRIFLFEKNNVNPERDYIKHEINYHPHSKHFTI